MKRILVTGSSGLIGSEAVSYFAGRGDEVFGVDNNMRAEFFGPKGDTSWNRDRLRDRHPKFRHLERDIRDRTSILKTLREIEPDIVIHAAAQPSHDLAAKVPFDDFDVNAVGTFNLLEATRQLRDTAHVDPVFIFMSTNKVYGDAPNELPFVERETRWDYARPEDSAGINEEMRIDRCLHSLFGASKVAADIVTQEYGRYFGIKTGVFRGGCLTGPNHSGVELHGFLSYLFKCVKEGLPYTIFGYRGKQVRDNIHSLDVIRAFEAFAADPRPGEVYNLGGCRENSCSMKEAIASAEHVVGKQLAVSYVEENRKGDHICYISDMSKFRSHYPAWSMTKTLDDIYRELAGGAEA